MKKASWIALGCLFVSGVACAQQGGSPAATSQQQQAQTTVVGSPAHPATEDQIREYISLIRAEKLAHEVMDSGFKAMQTTAAPYYPSAMWDELRAAAEKLDVTAVYVKVYQQYMSESDMQAVIEFYRSPAGQKLLESQPLAIRDAQAIMREKATVMAETVVAKYKDQIQAAKKQYDSQHSTPAIDLGPTPQ